MPPDRPDRPPTDLADRPPAAWALNLTNLTDLFARTYRGNSLNHHFQKTGKPNLSTFSQPRLVRLVRLVTPLFFNAILPTDLDSQVGQVGHHA